MTTAKLLENIQNELRELRKEMNEIKNVSVRSEEMIFKAHRLVEDLSCKVDEDINIQLAAPKETKKTTSKRTLKTKNIDKYFKDGYKTDPAKFAELLTAEELAELFETHKEEIEGKKDKETAKINLIYKLIRGNKDKYDRLKEIKLAEDEQYVDSEPELIVE